MARRQLVCIVLAAEPSSLRASSAAQSIRCEAVLARVGRQHSGSRRAARSMLDLGICLREPSVGKSARLGCWGPARAVVSVSVTSSKGVAGRRQDVKAHARLSDGAVLDAAGPEFQGTTDALSAARFAGTSSSRRPRQSTAAPSWGCRQLRSRLERQQLLVVPARPARRCT